MRFEIDLDADTPVYRQIAASISRAVSDGQLNPGDRLPATRDLAAALEVNTETVHRAYKLLVSRGIADARVGRGTTINSQADLDLGRLDTKIDQLWRLAREYGLTTRQLMARIEAVTSSE